jgi:two-component system, cell cycle response regulator CpdR
MARILVAEDDNAVRELVTRIIASRGHEVTAVADGAYALEAVGSGQFDLLVTDIVMPRLDGIALALKLAKSHPGLPILMMTGYALERQRAHDLEVLVHRVLSKPFTVDQFLVALGETLEGKTAAPESREISWH